MMKTQNKHVRICLIYVCVFCVLGAFLWGCAEKPEESEDPDFIIERPDAPVTDVTMPDEDIDALIASLPPEERELFLQQMAEQDADAVDALDEEPAGEVDPYAALQDMPQWFEPNEEVRQLVSDAMMALRLDLSDEEKLARIEELAGINHPIVLDVASLALEEANPEIREAALEAIMEINDPSVVPLVVKALDDELAELREYALDALIEIDDPAVNEALQKALRDESFFVVENAMDIMVFIESPNILPSLAQALEHPSEEIWETALMALDEMQDPRVVDILIEKGLLSPNEMLREDSVDSLMFLTDQDFETYHEWRSWWDRNRSTFRFDQ